VAGKPLLAVAGLLTVLLAMASGFGLAMNLGFGWQVLAGPGSLSPNTLQAINLVAMFLLLGIGLDSVFLLLASWARWQLAQRGDGWPGPPPTARTWRPGWPSPTLTRRSPSPSPPSPTCSASW
jgi:hypothetical protein